VKRPARYFRAGVGAVVLEPNGRVLLLERSDVPGSWQFPQGGLDDGETPLQAARREVEEETGIPARTLRLLGQHPDLLAYELPAGNQSPRTGMGQVQYWFYFETRAVHVPFDHLPPGEFRAARWSTMARAVSGAAPFRAPLYEKLARHLRTLRRR
jgi:putative (di)nucleoside polyphosphate hydrolase